MAKTKRIPEIIVTIIGSMILSVLLYVILGLPPIAIPIMFIVFGIIVGTAIFRLKKDTKIEESFNSTSIPTQTDDIDVNRYTSVVSKGAVYGESIVACHVVGDMFSATKIIFGGEPKSYQKVLTISRKLAVSRMMEEANKKGANLITGVRLATPSISNQSAELIAYGTAWIVRSDFE